MSEANEDIVEVYSAADITEAYFLRDILGDAGISTRVVGDTLTGMLPPGEETTPRLWVFRNDEARARELLKEFELNQQRPERDDERPGSTWLCPSCGESVETDFELCWNCQTPRKPY